MAKVAEQKKNKELIVKSYCSSCNGNGLYSGMCEAKGEAVICLDCDGTGCNTIYYRPYTGRKITRKIKTVRFKSTKLFIENSSEQSWTYKEFLEKIKEPKCKK